MLKVENVSFSYADNLVLKDISFEASLGENIAIMGESGSGKSTLLDLVYGEQNLNQGKISWKGESILGPAYNLVVGYDFMKYVSQEFDLMPFITVEENIGKHLSNFYKKDKKKRTSELIEIVELEAFAKTKVNNLSGGQKQRVALARALAKQPEILLLDEPFSHIDNFKKQSLRRNIFGHLKQEKISCLVASHDKDDVLGFADQIIILKNKRILAKDSPRNLYKKPKTPYIASFFGEHNAIRKQDLKPKIGDEAELIVYASQLKIVDTSSLKVKVKESYFNGKDFLVRSTYLDREILFYSPNKISENEEVYLDLK